VYAILIFYILSVSKLLNHNEGVDKIFMFAILLLIYHGKDPYGVSSPSGAFSFCASNIDLCSFK